MSNVFTFWIRLSMEIGHCDTDEMMSDCMNEGPQGVKFRKFRNQIVDFESEESEQLLISKHDDMHIWEQKQ